MQLDELEVSSTVSTTVGLLVDIILVYCSSSDVSPSLGKMIESAIFVSHMFVLAAWMNTCMWVKKAGPEGIDIMLKIQCKNGGFC